MINKLLSTLRDAVVPSASPTPSGEIPLIYPIGHFYSPIADPADLRRREGAIWQRRDSVPGVDLRAEAQFALLDQLAPHASTISYPVEAPGDPTAYFYNNDQYPVLDAEFLHVALCHFKPKTMIEVGSGFSSLVTAHVNRTLLNGQLRFICIEPYPRQFLIDGVPGISDLVRQKVEDIPLEFFDELGRDDVLFIDSSHVSKVGSDVNYLFFEVLPRLASGVIVHIHDIFLPDEYPKVWMLDQGRNWNEQYLVRAFLQYNDAWEVLWAAYYMGTRHTEAVQKVFPRFPSLGGGGSLWIQRR